MVSTLGSVGLAPAVGVVLVLAAAGCGSKVATLAQAESPTPSISPVSELGAVPWADRPGRFFEPSPLPAHPLPANARPCTASDVRVVPDGGNGGGGHSYQTFVFRNVGTTSCVLRGYPSVVASEPGEADVTAAAQPPQQHAKSPVTGARAALALQHRGKVLVVSLDNNDPSQVTSYCAGKYLGGLICLLKHRPWWRRMQPPGLQMLRTTQC
jgi:hypothetical protein